MALKLGVTHAYPSMAEALEPINEITWGRMADKAILTVGLADGSMIGEMLGLVGKAGTAVVTSMTNLTKTDVTLNLFLLAMLQQDVQGSIFGGVTRV